MTLKEPKTEHPDGKVTGLCYLSSINLEAFYDMLPPLDENLTPVNEANDVMRDYRRNYVYHIVKSLDNNIENDYYPVKLGVEDVAKRYRYIGIGASNLATLFARLDIKFSSQKALDITAYIFDAFSQDIIVGSTKLAKERGAAAGFSDTNWVNGLPYHKCNIEARKLTKFRPSGKEMDKVLDGVIKHGLRNCLLMAIAPTATSAVAPNFSESVDPVSGVYSRQEGTIQVDKCINFDMEVLSRYDNAFSIDNSDLIKLAAVRQMFIDQAQSINMFYKDSKFDVEEGYKELELAHSLGIKSLYYAKFLKESGSKDAECEGCT